MRGRERQHRAERVEVARKSSWPGRIGTAATTEKTMIVKYGVVNGGETGEGRSGSWRCSAIDHVSREIPISPAFVAMIRIVAARTPT